MCEHTSGIGDFARNPVFNAVADRKRRRILTLLLDRSSPVAEEDLAVHLAAAEQEKSLMDVTDVELESLRAEFIHIQLPMLEATNLINWDMELETVTTTDHPVLQDPKFERMIEAEPDGWDDVLANLTHKRRRIALSVLKDREEPIPRDDLAHRMAVHETDEKSDIDSAAIKALCVSLHHVHLPKLQQADLITYDIEARTVSYEGHPVLADEWLDAAPDETPRAVLPSAAHAENVWTIEGRDNVIARGQSLFEQAHDELFLMFTTAGLLEDGCIRRLQNAVDRDVNVYLGSQTPDVRNLVRERVPEVVIWEPQMDWLNLPPNYEKVGRLVFADREAIMLATLGEQTTEGFHRETAITGTGENNPLVILMRELLGSRLDHLDAQSEDFRSEIPL